MPRVGRHLLTLCAAVSMLLCVVTLFMWPRSHSRWEWAAYQRPSGRIFTVTSRLGALDLSVTDGWPAGQFPRVERRSDPVLVASLPPPSEWALLGFGVNRLVQNVGVGTWTGPSTCTSIIIPYWFLVVITIAPALLILVPRFQRSRRPPGLCPSCGYDLRATPGRCPECGTAAAAAAANAEAPAAPPG